MLECSIISRQSRRIMLRVGRDRVLPRLQAVRERIEELELVDYVSVQDEDRKIILEYLRER